MHVSTLQGTVETGALALCVSALTPKIGPVAAGAVCAKGVGTLFSSCDNKGGTMWCLERCDGFANQPMGYCPPRKRMRLSPPVLLSSGRTSYERSHCRQTGMPKCYTATYCQLPGTPEPTVPSGAAGAAWGVRAGAPAPAAGYPSGSIAAFDTTVGKYRIAVPAGLSGEVTHREVALVASRPAGVSLVPFDMYKRATGQAAWYKDWRTYAVAGGVAVLGAGAYLVIRKRRKRRKRR
jgi:hypothetical protein